MKSKILFLFVLGFLYSSLCAQEAVRLKVMTYNLRFGELASLEDIGGFIAAQNPDFVALQELDCMTKRGGVSHQHGRNFITELGYYTKMFPLYGKTIPHAGGLYGIGMLTKLPYIHVEKVMLPKEKAEHEARALLMAEVELPGGDTVIVASTHLDHTSATARARQLEVITSLLKEKPFPVLLGGDFNDTPDSKEIRKYFEDWLPLSDNSMPTFPVGKPEEKIDYLYAYPPQKWKLISSKVEGSTLSDHLPILSEVEFIR